MQQDSQQVFPAAVVQEPGLGDVLVQLDHLLAGSDLHVGGGDKVCVQAERRGEQHYLFLSRQRGLSEHAAIFASFSGSFWCLCYALGATIALS